MATHTQAQASQRSGVRARSEEGHGWLTYAGVLMLIGGVLNIVWGVAAIGNAHFFVANAHYVISNLNTWGWITLVIGAVVLVAGINIFNRATWAIWVGVVALSLNAVSQLLSIPAYPFWSLAMFAVTLVAIYGLVAYGGSD